MARPSWGTKRTCQSCGARFYDMRRDPIICPKCSAVYDPEALLKTRRGRAATGVEKIIPAKAPVPEEIELIEGAEVEAEIADEEPVEAEKEEEEDLIEDASELGEDEDVSQVIEKNDGEEEP